MLTIANFDNLSTHFPLTNLKQIFDFLINVIIPASNEIVFINFYADWCKFSNMLMPIFDEAADEVTKAAYDTGKVVMGKVDCDKEAAIATRFHTTKYPTLKLFQNGIPAKKEYRGNGQFSLIYILRVCLKLRLHAVE